MLEYQNVNHFSFSSSVNNMLLTSTLSNVEYFCSCWRWGLCLTHRPQAKSERETWMRLGNVCSYSEMIKIISPYIIHNKSVGTLLRQLGNPLIMKHFTSDNNGSFELLDLGRNNFWFDWKDLIYTQINPGQDWKCIFARWEYLYCPGHKCGRGDGSWGWAWRCFGCLLSCTRAWRDFWKYIRGYISTPTFSLSLGLMISSCLFSFLSLALYIIWHFIRMMACLLYANNSWIMHE